MLVVIVIFVIIDSLSLCRSLALPHILVAKDDDAGSEVAKDANNEEESVKYGEGYESLQVNVTGACH